MTPEMITAVSSIIISLFTLGYSIIAKRKQNVLQSITEQRIKSFNELCNQCSDFARHYRAGNVEGMLDAEAQTGMQLRRDYEDSKLVYEQMKKCRMSAFNDHDYTRLLCVFNYLIARYWQRIRYDAERNIFLSERKIQAAITERVSPLLEMIQSMDSEASAQDDSIPRPASQSIEAKE